MGQQLVDSPVPVKTAHAHVHAEPHLDHLDLGELVLKHFGVR
jgi:hypothetical protein